MLVLKCDAVLLLALVANYAVPAVAQEAAEPQPPDWTKHTPYVIASSNPERTVQICRTLDEPLKSLGFEFGDVPLQEVAKYVSEEYDVEVQLDIPALDDLGLSPDAQISANVQNVSLASALKIVLRRLGLVHVVDGEILLITSEDEALTRLTTTVYPIGDLLTSSPTATKQDEDTAEVPAYDMDSLIDVITSCVASDTWVVNGGPEAEIRALQPGLLVIAQTQGVHEEIANLLSALRQAKKHEFAVPYSEPDGGRPTSRKVERAYRDGEQWEQGGGVF